MRVRAWGSSGWSSGRGTVIRPGRGSRGNRLESCVGAGWSSHVGLRAPERPVPTFAVQQLPVRALLDDLALVQDVNLVGILDRVEAVGHQDDRLAGQGVRRFSWIIRSVAVSRWLVASSKMRIRLPQQDRAMASRCRWPPDRLAPRSPISVS